MFKSASFTWFHLSKLQHTTDTQSSLAMPAEEIESENNFISSV